MPKLNRPKRKSYLPPKEAFTSKPKEEQAEQQKFYNSDTWRSTSVGYRKYNPLCEVSKAKGIIKEATEVDHIIPVNQGGAKYDSANLMSLCHHVHMKKTGMESHKPILVAWMLNEDGDKIPVKRDQIIYLLSSD